MAPPTVKDEHDDLDDLDDVLDEFNAPSAPRATAPPPPSSTAAASSSVPAPATSSSAPKATDDLFPDPDDDALPDSLDSLDPQLAKDLEEGMKALLAGLGPGATGASSSGETSTPGTGGAGEDAFDENEFRRVMEELMKGGPGAGAAGGADAEGAGDDEALRNLLAALSMGGEDAAAPASSAKSAPSTSKPAAPSSSGPSTQPANFQEAIAASMSKLRDSSTSANAAAESSRPGDNAGMAAMLAQMAGMPDLGNIDSEEGLQDMLDEMMKQLMSRDMLYEPLKELADKYPAYLEQHRSTLSAADIERYEKQRTIVRQIVDKFEEPGADKQPPYTPEEEAQRSARLDAVVDLVAKMNECGAPPNEIMGEMPPGMDLGADGMPKVPDMVAVIDSYDAFKSATSQDKLVIIDFWATWCGPCKVIGPVFEKLESSFPNIGFFKCDVDAQEEVAGEVGIKAMPTFVLFKNGEKVGTVVGADPNKLKAALELHNESA
ncbi:Peroxisome chaperone and import receptor [Rhodotorula toruloides]